MEEVGCPRATHPTGLCYVRLVLFAEHHGRLVGGFGFFGGLADGFAAGLLFSLFDAAGNVGGDVDQHFGVQNDLCLAQAEGLDRVVENDLAAVHSEAVAVQASAMSRTETEP